MKRTKPPFRADHVGSLLRPAPLKAAREKRAKGEIGAAELKAVEDREIERVIRKQEEVGLDSITDGEFRRSWWHLDFLEGLDGVEGYQAAHGIAFQGGETKPRAVRAAGKKIIQYHGVADAVIPAQYSIGYYEAVEKYLRRDNRDFYRLFMAPGMEHCGGGPGPNAFGTPYDPRPFGAGYDPSREFNPQHHVLAALVRWVENGEAPERIVATKYQDDDAAKRVVLTRPLCVYPRVARWKGKGSTDDATNFVCSRN